MCGKGPFRTPARTGRVPRSRKVLVIGLDSAPPKLVFEDYLVSLPHIRRLVEGGLYGEIESTIPPITIPAWTSFVTSKSPGVLGFFGFRNRKDYSYDEIFIANSRSIKEDTLWDILSREGKKVGIIGVPQTYPPKPVNGFMVTSFLTPDTESEYTYPPELKGEIEGLVGRYVLDVEDFRTEDKENLLHQIYDMTEKRFKVAGHFLKETEWDFFMMVEMGPDRIQHGFWKFTDPAHKKYSPGSKYENSIRDYYVFLDEKIGELLALAGDDSVVILVSDHGAKKMDGCININDWLVSEGYLVLRSKPQGLMRLEEAEVDWERTTAWGWGGYYGRIFLNVKGREKEGLVEPENYEATQDEIAGRIRAIRDEEGRQIKSRVFKPQEVYHGRYVHRAPDLMVYFGDLHWRSTGEIGHASIHSFETEIGPDDAVHDEKGIFVLYDPRKNKKGRVDGLHLLDGAPTILSLMGIPILEDMEGKAIE